MELEGADNRFTGGDSYESSWLHAPGQTLSLQDGVTWNKPDHRDYAETRSDLQGGTRLYSLNFYARLYRTSLKAISHDNEPAHSLDFLAGYHWYSDSVRLSEGDNTLSSAFFEPTPPRGPFSRLDTTAEMTWKGWRGGFRERSVISRLFSMEAKLAFGPKMAYRGEGTRNLSTDPANVSYLDTANGQLVEFSISGTWKVKSNFQVEGGYMGWNYGTRSGKRDIVYSNGTSSRVKLDEIRTGRKGWFLGLVWKYH
jgi:hypothetical protein